MKQLEFRAYDEVFDEIYTPQGIRLHPELNIYIPMRLEREGTSYYMIDHPIMQFTTFKDKNEVKIFTGDIVFFTLFDVYGNDSTYIGEVAFENGEFVIKSEHEHGDEGVFGLWYVWYNDEGDYLEVIGNVHQNKDLLTKTVEDVEKERANENATNTR